MSFMPMSNIKVYDLDESIIASGYPMRTTAEMREVLDSDKKRIMNLTTASNGNGAHGQWLTGVRVNFDLTFSNKAWVEAERYRFLEFVSSQSTMHRITKFKLDEQYMPYVDERIINIMQEKIELYNKSLEEKSQGKNISKSFLENLYLQILYSNPSGFMLTARMTTNYRCLLNIFVQRYNHRLPEWRAFCAQLLTLPYFKELVEAYFYGGMHYLDEDIKAIFTRVEKENKNDSFEGNA